MEAHILSGIKSTSQKQSLHQTVQSNISCGIGYALNAYFAKLLPLSFSLLLVCLYPYSCEEGINFLVITGVIFLGAYMNLPCSHQQYYLATRGTCSQACCQSSWFYKTLEHQQYSVIRVLLECWVISAKDNFSFSSAETSKCHIHHLQWWCKIFRTGLNTCSEHAVFYLKLSLLSHFWLLLFKSSRKSKTKLVLRFCQCRFRVFFILYFFCIYLEVTAICHNFNWTKVYVFLAYILFHLKSWWYNICYIKNVCVSSDMSS